MERRRVMEPLGMAWGSHSTWLIGTALKFYASLLCNNRNRGKEEEEIKEEINASKIVKGIDE